jgi:hypothetical protein
VRLELFAVDLYGVSMGEDEGVAGAERWVKSKKTIVDGFDAAYIHGSVELSPTGDIERSEQRPGAKTPRP